MNTYTKIRHLFLALSLCTLFSSCEEPFTNYQSSGIIDSGRSPLLSREVRSGAKDSEQFSVTKEMAALFVRSYRENEVIISIEPYRFKDEISFYVINLSNGWMIISSDSRVQPILGEGDKENLILEKLDNPGLEAWLNMNAEFIFNVKNKGLNDYDENIVRLWDGLRLYSRGMNYHSPDPDEGPIWVRYTTYTTIQQTLANIPHLLQTKWGQKNPWNCSLPIDPNDSTGRRLITGCGPTAIAQVLYYFHNSLAVPNDFWHSITPYINQTYTSPYRYKLGLYKSDYQTHSDRWDYMPVDSTVTESFSNVSDLMLDIGVRVGATYSATLTTTSVFSGENLASCGLASSIEGYSYSRVKSDLISYKPVLITASNSSGGHAWVIDGCLDQLITVRQETFYYMYQEGVTYPDEAEYISESEVLSLFPNAYSGMSIVETNTIQNRYLLMNYGWDGKNNDGHYTVLESGYDWANEINNYPRIGCNLFPSQMN